LSELRHAADIRESYTKEEALAGMQYYFPQLKRWKKETKE